MQNDTSNFVVNIIPLQNIQTNVSGVDAVGTLTASVAEIKKMVNTDQKKLFANSLGSYTTGGSISITSPMNLCNVGLTTNGTIIGTTGSALSNLSSIISLSATNGAFSTAVTIATASVSSAVLVSESGNLTVSGSGTFGGICYATQFVTLSDMMMKESVREWRSPVLVDLQKIRPYVFSYLLNKKEDIGLMAQEVEGVWPYLVKDGVKGKYVNYDGVVTLLVKAVQELTGRVSTLECNLR
jgi:hypothetical protein